LWRMQQFGGEKTVKSLRDPATKEHTKQLQFICRNKILLAVVARNLPLKIVRFYRVNFTVKKHISLSDIM